MELLQKFAAVEIQTDHRITEMDKDYCVQHQKAYEAAISSFQELAFFWEDMNKAQQELLGDSKSPFFHNYLVSHGGPSISQISINSHIEALHIDFIMTLTHYFNSTYHVSVSSAEVSKVLLPEKPSGRWQDDYVEVNKEYQRQMQSLIVRYQDVVDQIILRLDGRSFSEQAFYELYNKCHNAAWNNRTQKPLFERKKDTISNLLQMVLAKEKINLFMKGQDTDLDQIYEKFGVDYNLLALLMEKGVDKDGNFEIRWGEQRIA